MSEEDVEAPEREQVPGGRHEEGRDVVAYLYWAALAALALLALVALLQFYLSASRAITIWVTREYRPLFQAAFNLVVLLVTGVGISLLVRRLMGRTGGETAVED